MKSLLAFSFCFFTLAAQAERWDKLKDNNPHTFSSITGTRIITDYNILPTEGKLDDERLGWSETYWPANKGGIAYRWNHPDPTPFNYTFLSKEKVLSLSRAQLEQLSPAELYDISQGDYTYQLTRKTLGLFTPYDLWWEGICHGWAQAAANYPEPKKVLVKNPDGVLVPFGASDVKGLLAMHDAYNSKGHYSRIGNRCHAPGKVPGEGSSRDANVTMPAPAEAEAEACRDVNPGAFHIAMTNMIGIHSLGLVADVDRFNDVWNQPVVSYETSFKAELPVPEEQFNYGVARRISVSMKMVYGEELQFANATAIARGDDNFVSKLPVTRTKHQEFRSKDYEYILELDQDDNIIGGEWVSVTRPDFIWTKKRDTMFLDSPMPLSGLSKIYKPVNL